MWNGSPADGDKSCSSSLLASVGASGTSSEGCLSAGAEVFTRIISNSSSPRNARVRAAFPSSLSSTASPSSIPTKILIPPPERSASAVVLRTPWGQEEGGGRAGVNTIDFVGRVNEAPWLVAVGTNTSSRRLHVSRAFLQAPKNCCRRTGNQRVGDDTSEHGHHSPFHRVTWALRCVLWMISGVAPRLFRPLHTHVPPRTLVEQPSNQREVAHPPLPLHAR